MSLYTAPDAPEVDFIGALDSLVLDHLSEAVIITDTEHRILAVNRAFSQMTGYSLADTLGKTPKMLRSYRHSDEFYREIEQALRGEGRWQGEIWNRRKDGSHYASRTKISRLPDSEGRPLYYLGVSSDLSEEQQVMEQIHFLTHYDSLTGLPDRNQFLQEIERARLECNQESLLLAVVAIKVQSYQLIQEGMGFNACDQVVYELAHNLKKQAITKGGLGRVTEDTFAMLIPQLASTSQLVPMLQTILQLEKAPVKYQGQELNIDLQMGISVYPPDAETAELLLERALMALRQPASAQGQAFHFFTPQLTSVAQSRLTLVKELRQALRDQQLELYYQPKVKSLTGKLVGAEALIRWNHPSQGFIPPCDFIPLAEQFGLIRQIGAWVIQEACRQQHTWQQAGLDLVPVAVNLSAAQLEDSELCNQLKEALAIHRLTPDLLELELTESMLLEDCDQTLALLHAFKDLGVSLALDDFGTGHSSLSYLSRLPFDKLKIDRSFVMKLPDHNESRIITNTIISMAHNLKMKVVAEGVETAEQFRYLKARDCEEIQGYYYSKPLPAERFEELLKAPPKVDMEAIQAHREEPTLLLVDDEANVVSALRRTLRQQPYRVLTATSAQEAMLILDQERVQVVLCDQRMPNMTGCELLEQVKSTHPQVVRMILSGYTDLDSILYAINQGEIYRFLTKPWQEEELIETVASAFDKYALQDNLEAPA